MKTKLSLSAVQIDCLHYIYTKYSKPHIDTNTNGGGYKYRTLESLLKKGLVMYNAAGPVGGWYPTQNGSMIDSLNLRSHQ